MSDDELIAGMLAEHDAKRVLRWQDLPPSEAQLAAMRTLGIGPVAGETRAVAFRRIALARAARNLWSRRNKKEVK